MDKKNTIPLTYGLLIGVLTSIWVLVEFLLGFHNEQYDIGKYSGYFAAIIPIILLWFAIRDYRKLFKEKFTLKNGLTVSLLTMIVAGIASALFMFSYHSWINPEFGAQAVERQIENLRTEGLTEEELVDIATLQLLFFSPIVQAAITFIATIIQGIFIGLIITLIQKLFNNKPHETHVSGGSSSQSA